MITEERTLRQAAHLSESLAQVFISADRWGHHTGCDALRPRELPCDCTYGVVLQLAREVAR